MATLSRSQIVPYSAQQMFDLVNDVEQYPQFLPWCSQVKILEHSAAIMKARVSVGKPGLSHAFITQNTLYPHEKIEMQLVEGPFRFLEGIWQFQDQGEGMSQVALNLAFEFNNPLLALSLGTLINPAFSTLVQMFTLRAQVVYGK